MEQKVEGFVRRIFETHLGEENSVEMLWKVLDSTGMVGKLLFLTLQSGGRIIWCESGGNASGAGNLAEAIAGDFQHKYGAHSSIVLTANSSGGIDQVTRKVQTSLTSKDALVAISAFGNEEEILQVLNAARSLGAKAVGILGYNGGRAAALGFCDLAIIVPDVELEQIQKDHLRAGRILCDIIDKHLSGEEV